MFIAIGFVFEIIRAGRNKWPYFCCEPQDGNTTFYKTGIEYRLHPWWYHSHLWNIFI